jgi:hypothetical protein
MAAISTYIVDKEPKRYGDKQIDYQARSKKIIAGGTKQLKAAISEGSSLKKAFFPLHEFLRKERHGVAVAHKTPNADHFGVMRNSDECIEKNLGQTFTFLNGAAYDEHGNKMLARLQTHLANMLVDAQKRAFLPKKEHIEKPCLGKRSTFEVEVFCQQEIIKRNWLKGADWTKSKKYEGINALNLTPFKRMAAMKAAEPDLYRQDKMAQNINAMLNTSPEQKKTGFVLATQRLEINGKLFPVSQYLTWLNCNEEENPITFMTGRSKVVILHLDATLIDDAMNDISALFERAVQWKKTEGVKELKDHVGLFCYEFSHTMPTCRGSEAVREYFENIIYDGIHGFDLKYDQKKSLGLEALTLPLDDFMNVYHNTVTVTERV